MIQQRFQVISPLGLTVKNITEIVQCALKYHSELTLIVDKMPVDLKSLMGVASLGIQKDTIVTITAEGMDEAQALLGIEEKITSLKLGSIL